MNFKNVLILVLTMSLLASCKQKESVSLSDEQASHFDVNDDSIETEGTYALARYVEDTSLLAIYTVEEGEDILLNGYLKTTEQIDSSEFILTLKTTEHFDEDEQLESTVSVPYLIINRKPSFEWLNRLAQYHKGLGYTIIPEGIKLDFEPIFFKREVSKSGVMVLNKVGPIGVINGITALLKKNDTKILSTTIQ
jgi:hypothetical protein